MRRLDGLLHGDYRGLTPGHGSEPGDARAYQPGDDVRRIDWSVTARTRQPHIRDAIADHELETWVVVDASASMAFGTANSDKADLALAAMAAVALMAARGGNRTGVVVATGTGPVVVPPAMGRTHVRSLLAVAHHQLHHPHPTPTGAASPLATALGTAARLGRRRSLVVIISDFLDPDAWPRALQALRIRHDVVAIEVGDPREGQLPDVGIVTFEDPETGALIEVQTADPRLRERYAAAASAQRADIAAHIRHAGADHLELSTGRNWLVDVARFITTRRRRAAMRRLPMTTRGTP